MDFVSEEKAFSMRDLLATYPELVILKAFTKTFAMPGIRLGYCLSGSSELITALHQSGRLERFHSGAGGRQGCFKGARISG